MSFQTEDKGGSRFRSRPLQSLSSFLLAIAVGLISSFTFSAAYDMAVKALSEEPAAVEGLWHGRLRGVHAITVSLRRRGDRLYGTARFYTILATDAGPRASGESQQVPLINPRLRGRLLTFEVRDPDAFGIKRGARMEMRITGEGEAELRRETKEEDAGEMERIIMLREHSF